MSCETRIEYIAVKKCRKGAISEEFRMIYGLGSKESARYLAVKAGNESQTANLLEGID